MDLITEVGEIAQISPITILDIGSNPEGELRWGELVRRGAAVVYGIDGQDPECPIFVGDVYPATFHETRWPGCSSILKPNSEVIDSYAGIGTGQGGNFNVVKSYEVETDELDSLELPGIDFIKLDTQGSEGMILKSGTDVMNDALMIESEVEFVEIYKDQMLFSDVDQLVRQFGFQFHRFMDLGTRCRLPARLPNPYRGVSQLLWADAVWAKEPETDAQAIKLALLYHYLYRSYDFAAYCISKFDQELCDRYLHWFETIGHRQTNFLPIREY